MRGTWIGAAACVLAAAGVAQNAPGQVVGVGGFSHIVADVDRAVAFYVGGMGLEFRRPLPAAFSMPDWIRNMGNTPPGALSKPANLRIPGSPLGVELIGYKNIEVHPVRPGAQDAGAAALVLYVRDKEALVARLRAAGGTLIYGGETPLMQDPDGFYVQLTTPQRIAGDAPAGNIVGAGFAINVQNIDSIPGVYGAVLGLTGGMVVSSLGRTLSMEIPGTGGLKIEFRDSQGRGPAAQRSRVPDPGTPILQLQVRDTPAATRALAAAGWEVISAGGEPVVQANGARFVIVRDPNNLFLELFERVP